MCGQIYVDKFMRTSFKFLCGLFQVQMCRDLPSGPSGNSYHEEISERFSILSDVEDIEQRWTNFKSAVQEAAKKSIGFRRGSRREQWILEHTWRLIDKHKIVKEERDQGKLISNAITLGKKYNKLNKAAKNSCTKDKKAWVRNKCIEAEEAASSNHTKTLYKIIRDMSSSNCNNENLLIKNLQGTALQSEEEQNKRWVEQFFTVLNQNPPTELFTDIDDEVDNDVEDENIPLKPITLDKVKEGLKDLANKKAAGLDLIPAELLKCGGEVICCKLTCLVNIVWPSSKVPDEWKRSAIVKLPKKGNLRDCNNWRGITLLVITRNFVCWILLKRLQSVADDKL